MKYLSKVDSDNLCWSENLKWFEDNYNAMDDEFSSPDFSFKQVLWYMLLKVSAGWIISITHPTIEIERK